MRVTMVMSGYMLMMSMMMFMQMCMYMYRCAQKWNHSYSNEQIRAFYRSL